MPAAAKEGTEQPPSNSQILMALNRIEVKLTELTAPKGRLARTEDDVEDIKKLVGEHERKIQRASGGLAVLIMLWGGLEALFHKIWR